MRILAQLLGSGIADNPELRTRLVSLLEEYQDESYAGAAYPEPFVIEALFNFAHTYSADQLVYLAELAASTNRILRDRGASEKIEPKAVGWILRYSLKLPPKRNAKGFAIRLTESVRRRIHQLAVEFQAWNKLAPECNDCKHIAPGKNDFDEPAAKM